MACRSSGVLLTHKLIAQGQIKLVSIHATETAAGAAVVKVFDGLDNTGTEVARITLAANQTIEFDMHGVICTTGLYYEELSGSAAVSVEFN
tara:strand:+ start:981 stop:1253 length:273 start_codon:yes stop_codon:yes gene_type:complete